MWVAFGSASETHVKYYMAFADRASFTWLKLLNTNNTRGSIRRKGIDQSQIHNKSYARLENLNMCLCGGWTWTFCPNDNLWVRQLLRH